jgi:hypothetical protein
MGGMGGMGIMRPPGAMLYLRSRDTETQRRDFRFSIASGWKFKSKIENQKSKISHLGALVAALLFHVSAANYAG